MAGSPRPWELSGRGLRLGYTRLMGNGIRIGRILGVQITLHPSWFVIAVLLTYLLAAGQLPATNPGWSDGLYWVVGAVISLLFF